MGITANIDIVPWKRSLALVKNLEADAILAASITSEREMFLHFPNEPVSKGVTVFFKRKQRNIPLNKLENLDGVRAGAMLGYKYCEELDKSSLIVSASRVPTLEQNFSMLLLDRIDLVVEVDAVGFYTANEMGISDQISVMPNTRYCSGGNYLAFAKKPGNDQITIQFGKELKDFKATNEYKEILEKYGVEDY